MKTVSRELLLNDDSSASAVFLAIREALGTGCLAWEPESVWLELRDQDVDLSLTNRDKFMAMSTLLSSGSYYWDAAVFENTTMALSHLPSSPEILQEASPAQMSWAIFEAEAFLDREKQEAGEFDYEPARYAAVSLHRTGLVIAPELLAFAQDELDKLNRGQDLILREDVRKRWNDLDKAQLEDLELAETPIDVQISRLAADYLYVVNRAKDMQDELAKLG